MPAEKGRNAALTQEPDPDNAGVGRIIDSLVAVYYIN